MHWVSIVLRPFMALALFVLAWGVARGLKRVIPEGRIKEALWRPHEIVPTTAEEARNWWPVVWLFAAQLVVFGIIGLLMWQAALR